ncbi:hypothetical protein KKB28_00720, partial [bacterium]|nr:hypothetical protein [bacterium]
IHGISSALSNDRKENILKREKDGEILFLVDIPGERKGSSISLYYRPESRTSRSYRTEEGGVQMEDSIIWMNLSQDFLRSVGKVRVFCHPDIAEICTALKRQEIEGALEAAYQSTS